MTDRRWCTQPDRDVPKIECGYPLPCPFHTAVIDVEKKTVTIPHRVPIASRKKIKEVAKAVFKKK